MSDANRRITRATSRSRSPLPRSLSQQENSLDRTLSPVSSGLAALIADEQKENVPHNGNLIRIIPEEDGVPPSSAMTNEDGVPAVPTTTADTPTRSDQPDQVHGKKESGAEPCKDSPHSKSSSDGSFDSKVSEKPF